MATLSRAPFPPCGAYEAGMPEMQIMTPVHEGNAKHQAGLNPAADDVLNLLLRRSFRKIGKGAFIRGERKDTVEDPLPAQRTEPERTLATCSNFP